MPSSPKANTTIDSLRHTTRSVVRGRERIPRPEAPSQEGEARRARPGGGVSKCLIGKETAPGSPGLFSFLNPTTSKIVAVFFPFTFGYYSTEGRHEKEVARTLKYTRSPYYYFTVETTEDRRNYSIGVSTKERARNDPRLYRRA